MAALVFFLSPILPARPPAGFFISFLHFYKRNRTFAVKERQLKPKQDMSYEYTIRVPSNERTAFRLMARKMGWEVSGPKKLSAYERSKLEAQSGKVHSFNSVEEMFASLEA